jgi:hypothetical protein
MEIGARVNNDGDCDGVPCKIINNSCEKVDYMVPDTIMFGLFLCVFICLSFDY